MAESTATSPADTECPTSISSSGDQDGPSTLPQDSSHTSRGGLCRYFLKGKCIHGDQCWNRHAQVNNYSMDDDYESKLCDRHKNMLKKEYNADGHPPNWVDAPEFVPKIALETSFRIVKEPIRTELCAYYVDGECPFGPECQYTHGDFCEICQKACMNPFDEDQRRMHTEVCEKELERDMELSFAVQRSRDKSCGICMEVIMEKEPHSERRFGILEKCGHTFCLACIRKWRKVKRSPANIESAPDAMVTRACPECRVSSDFVTPSQFWYDDEEEKEKLISDYKVALGKKACKYFKQGKGSCPFGGACFYLHAKPDGTIVELPPPVRRRRQHQNHDGGTDITDLISLINYFGEDTLMLEWGMDEMVYPASESGSE